MKEKIIKYLCDEQVVDYDRFSRGSYCGYFLNDDDSPVFPYSYIKSETEIPLKDLKIVMIEMRNDGLVELCNAVDSDGKPNGSGWSITEKGIKFAIENNILPTLNKEEN